MKIKIIAVKYFDWVIIAGLVIFLVIAAVKAFVVTDKEFDEIKEDITRSERTIRNKIQSSELIEEPRREIVAGLRNRFEHMPVINPYRRNPFVAIEDKVLPLMQLREGQGKDYKLKGARVNEVLTQSENASLKYNYDAESGDTLVRIDALKEGEAVLRVRDDTEQTYVFNVHVRKFPTVPPPNPPMEVVLVPRPPIERAAQREPASVIVCFHPNNPPAPTRQTGLTTGAHIYRKLAEAPESEYTRLTGQTPLAPLTREQAIVLRRRLTMEEEKPAESGPRTSVPAPSGPLVPSLAGETPAVAAQPGSDANAPRIMPGSYAFVDQTIDEGESYMYKIVTISTAEEAEPAECANPFVSAPVSAPSLVQFVLNSASGGRARFTLTRPDPETGQPVSQDFAVLPGMKIGGKVRKKITEGVDQRQGPRYKDIDFSTGCVLVDILPYRDVEYRLPLTVDSRTGKATYRARLKNDPRVLYLTPRGLLRWKGREEARTSATPGG